MASLINYAGIDETYPIAGRDNDSQGFRDNFSIIKNNFTAAKGEIEDLQLNTARLDDANDFTGNNLLNYNVVYNTEEFFDGGIVGNNAMVDWKSAPYQSFIVNSDTQFVIYNLPSLPKVAKMRLHVASNVNTSTWNLTFNISGVTAIKKSSRVPTSITVSSRDNPIIFDLWTFDSGNTLFVDYLGSFT